MNTKIKTQIAEMEKKVATADDLEQVKKILEAIKNKAHEMTLTNEKKGTIYYERTVK